MRLIFHFSSLCHFFSLAKKIPLTTQQDRHRKRVEQRMRVCSHVKHMRWYSVTTNTDDEHPFFIVFFEFTSSSRSSPGAAASAAAHNTSHPDQYGWLIVCSFGDCSRESIVIVEWNVCMNRFLFLLWIVSILLFHYSVDICCDEDGHANCVHGKKERKRKKSEINKHDLFMLFLQRCSAHTAPLQRHNVAYSEANKQFHHHPRWDMHSEEASSCAHTISRLILFRHTDYTCSLPKS